MAALYAVGNDGSVSLPSGYAMNVKVWAANIAYVSTDTTGFSHSGKTRRLGVVDITGSLAGQPSLGDSGRPWGSTTTLANIQPGGTISLSVYGGTATNGTTNGSMQFGAVFSGLAFNSDKNGDSTLTLNYEMNDSDGPTIVWATSLP